MKQNPFNIAGKIIIVTGAAGNLGTGYVQALADADAIVYAFDKDVKKLNEVFENNPTRNIIPMAVDLTIEDDVRKAVNAVLKMSPHIDGLVNNAAINPAVGVDDGTNLFAPYEEYSIDLFRKEIDANLTSMMITMKCVVPSMVARKIGSIINIASEVSVGAHDHRVYQTPGKYKSPAYSASKTAVVGLSRQWAARLGEHNVRVNAVSIGGVKFPSVPEDFAKRFGGMNMLGRMANPHEYDATIQYLLSDASSFITGSNLIIDGGKSAW